MLCQAGDYPITDGIDYNGTEHEWNELIATDVRVNNYYSIEPEVGLFGFDGEDEIRKKSMDSADYTWTPYNVSQVLLLEGTISILSWTYMMQPSDQDGYVNMTLFRSNWYLHSSEPNDGTNGTNGTVRMKIWQLGS